MERINQGRIGSPEESSKDVLTEILRNGAKRLLSEALEVEIEKSYTGSV